MKLTRYNYDRNFEDPIFDEEPEWTDEDEAVLEEWEEQRRIRIAEANEY